MKSQLAICLALSLLTTSCNQSGGSGKSAEGPTSSAQAQAAAPYSVNPTVRADLVKKALASRAAHEVIEQELTAAAPEDIKFYKEFFEAEGSGVARIFPHDSPKIEIRPNLTIPSGQGRFLDMVESTWEGDNSIFFWGTGIPDSFQELFGSAKDSTTNRFSLWTKYGTLLFGTKVDGQTIRTIGVTHPAVVALLAQNLPTGNRYEWNKIQDEFQTRSLVPSSPIKTIFEIKPGDTFVVRQVEPGANDTVLAMQWVRFDSVDDTAIVVWRTLRKVPAPAKND